MVRIVIQTGLSLRHRKEQKIQDMVGYGQTKYYVMVLVKSACFKTLAQVSAEILKESC